MSLALFCSAFVARSISASTLSSSALIVLVSSSTLPPRAVLALPAASATLASTYLITVSTSPSAVKPTFVFNASTLSSTSPIAEVRVELRFAIVVSIPASLSLRLAKEALTPLALATSLKSRVNSDPSDFLTLSLRSLNVTS